MNNDTLTGLDREFSEAGAAVPPALELDVERYRGDLAGFDLNEDQQRELLETLWSIMRSFVELGFTVDVCGQVFGDEAGGGGDAVESAITTSETPADGEDRDSP
ncbi:hypothetical protein STVA_28000 [Allostella vacuolata]|nr:hypothetical protein STVA_28000 [Stella vacuolata]